MTEWWHVPTWQGRQLKPERWSALYAPMRWTRKPRVVLVDDIFAGKWTNEERVRVFAVMALCPQHLFVLVTKHTDALRQWFDVIGGYELHSDGVSSAMWEISDKRTDHIHGGWPLTNLWLGTHVETQDEADRLVPPLLATPAALRFVHATPREPIHLDNVGGRWVDRHDALTGEWENDLDDVGSSTLSKWTNKLDWLIVEGGSGPMHPDWVRSLRDQCAGAGVPFSFAGWGAWLPAHPHLTTISPAQPECFIDDQRFRRTGNRHSGRLLDGVEHNALPEIG